MTVGRFLGDKMAILLHKKTCKYSFMTLTCQAEDDFFILGDTMVHNVELNWSKPLYHKPPPFNISQDAFCQMLFLYSFVWPHNHKICEFIPFQARKGGFCL